MIAYWHSWQDSAPPPAGQFAAPLTRYGGTSDTLRTNCDLFAWHCSPGQDCAAEGPVTAVVHGWIDNAPELAVELDLADTNPALVYSAALLRWGDRADAHCIGNYAAIARLQDGTLRLARSPWDAPPIYHHTDAERTVASPLLRVLFAAGAPRNLDYEMIVDQLAYDWRDGEEAAWYHEILQVPVGCAVTITRGGRRLDRWYSVENLPTPRFARDDDYPQAANALLEEAAAKALAQCERPAIALSGGLDSPLAADALVRAMPTGGRLPAVTFVPDREWGGEEGRGLMGDEAEIVRRFAKFNGAIDPHFADPDQGGFDYRSREIFQAMEIFAPGLANVGMMHGVWSKARELGCDMLLSADLGNQTFSDSGRWAYVEYARTGKWVELLRLLRERPGDSRPLWRNLAALSVLPQLPSPIRQRLRALVHPQRRDMTSLVTMLSSEARRDHAQRAKARGSRAAWDDMIHATSRMQAASLYALQANGPGADVALAFEQVHGIRRRDVTAYRPLVEYCVALPSEQFASQGMERRLARRMAKGRIPEEQRLEQRHGQHNIDWHSRMTPRRGEMLAYAQKMRDHPWLNSVADIDRMTDLIEHWPDAPDFTWENDWPRMLGLPRILLAAQFIGFAEGRNDL